MKQFILCGTFLFLFLNLFAQPEAPKVIDLDFETEISVEGNLENGVTIPLDWAQNSSVACFPGTRFIEYLGNHVFYRVELPAASDMEITVTPKSKKTRINFYALRLGAANMSVPPDVGKAISCEAAYPLYAGKPNLKAAAKSQSVEYMSIKKSYTILIGIAGAKDVTTGAFDLNIVTKSR